MASASAANAAAATARQSSGSSYYYPRWLAVIDDCYTMGTPVGTGGMPTVSYVRWRTYQVLDQYGNPWNVARNGWLAVSEIVQNTGGTPITGGATWTSRGRKPTISRDGVFKDELTVGGFFGGSLPPGTADQVFYGTGGFVSQPLMVRELDGTIYGILANYYAPNTVTINGRTTTKPCN